MKRLREDVPPTAQILVLLGDEGLSHPSLRVFRGVVERLEPLSACARRRNADADFLEGQLLAKKVQIVHGRPSAQVEKHEGQNMLGVLRAPVVPRSYQCVDRRVESHFEEKFDYGAQTSKRCKIARAFVHFDVDFSRVLCHNRCTPLVKVCVFANTTLSLFYEQSRGVFIFSACGFGEKIWFNLNAI